VISSRRLAREWALKILYQRDVGKTTLAEAFESAMERLRREFVLRGSRTASGSVSEQACLEVITAELRDELAVLSPQAIRVAAAMAGRLIGEAPYWQELRLEKAFKTAAPGVGLVPPRLLAPKSTSDLLPEPGDPLRVAYSALSPAERAALHAYAGRVQEALPVRLDAEMRQGARAFARDMAAGRPLGGGPLAVQDYLRERRETYNEAQQERWRKVGAVVQKQTGDWLRTASFAAQIVRGVNAQQKEIDLAIEGLAAGWRLERQVAVDRNILRLAGYEMLFMPGVPTGASINEAVELAKKYSTAESGRFVNGVLGALATLAGDKAATSGTPDDPDDGDVPLDLPEIDAIEEQD
jgi:N utilization substance protein B